MSQKKSTRNFIPTYLSFLFNLIYTIILPMYPLINVMVRVIERRSIRTLGDLSKKIRFK